MNTHNGGMDFERKSCTKEKKKSKKSEENKGSGIIYSNLHAVYNKCPRGRE